jgi:hypothetical protein
VFGIGRRKTHSQLVKAELGESLGHFVRAATHAASGVGETVGPRVESARDYLGPAATRVRSTASTGWGSTMTAFAPLVAAAASGAGQAGSTTRKASSKKVRMMRKKESMRARRRWSILTGLLAAGAVAGAVGAIAVRRRAQPDWDSYDPGRVMESVREDAEAIVHSSSDDHRRDTPKNSSGPDKAKPAGPDKAMAAGAGAKASPTEKVKDQGDPIPSPTSTITDSAKQGAVKGAAKADGLLGNNSPTPSRNSRG